MLRAIDEIRPSWVIGENVAGITTMVEGGICADLGVQATLFGEGDGVHRYSLRETFTIERICRDLEGLGYSVQPVLIPAAAVGAPHIRERIFILAHTNALRDGCNTIYREMEIQRGRNTINGNPPIPQSRQEKLGDLIQGFPSNCEPSRRWGKSPSVSPLFAGNDGLPIWVDRETLPKDWEEKSLAAYGNAIVPQVMYRIFQAINETTKKL